MNWIETTGTVNFEPRNKTKKHESQSGWKSSVIINIYDDLSEYYAWLLERRFGIRLNKPLRGSHFTIVNDRTSDMNGKWEEVKEKYNKKKIKILYYPFPVSNGEHWWLKSFSHEGESIRNELGLDYPFFGYHITIGLATHLQLEQSEYIMRSEKTLGNIIDVPNYKKMTRIK